MCIGGNRAGRDFLRQLHIRSRFLCFAGYKKALFPASVRHDGHHLRTQLMGSTHFLDILVCGDFAADRAAESGAVAGDFVAFFIFRAFSLVNMEMQLSILAHWLCPIGRILALAEDIGASQRDMTATRGIGTFDRPHPNPCKGNLSAFCLRVGICQQL